MIVILSTHPKICTIIKLKGDTDMAHKQLGVYTQKLFDTVITLRTEVDNLHQAYSMIQKQIKDMATLADKGSLASLAESLDMEKIAKLALIAATISHNAAIISNNKSMIDATHQSLLAATDAYNKSQSTTLSSKKRETSKGSLQNQE